MMTLVYNNMGSNKDLTVRFEAEYKETICDNIVDADGHLVNLGDTTKIKSNLIVYVNGKNFGSCRDSNFWTVDKTKDGYKIWGLPICFAKKDDADRFISWIESVIDNGRADDVKAFYAAKAEADRAADIVRAKDIVVRAERQRDIPDRVEADRRMAAYNNVANEGGSGYVPYIISREEYEQALKTIKEA